MTPSRFALFTLVIALALPGSAARASLWVSPEGDDQGPGTEEQPLRTITRARDIIRTLNRNMTDDITVFIAGTYHVSKPIEFEPRDSGSNGYYVVYTAAPGAHPVISGGCRISDWTVADAARGIWSAPAPDGLADTRDLYVDGSHAERTKARLLQAFAKEPAASAAIDPRAQWKNPRDIEFGSPDPGAIWSERIGIPPIYVLNSYELLGKRGEWYFDRPARRIYYTPRPGENLRTADVEAAATGSLIVGAGRKGWPLTGLVIKGIRFEYTTWPDPSEAGPSASRDYGEAQAAVRFTLAGSIQLLEDDFVHLATPALGLGPGLEGGNVEGCLFGDVSWTALRIAWASHVRVTDSRFSYIATAHHAGCAVDLAHSQDVAVEHNQIDHFPNAAMLFNGLPGAPGAGAANLIAAPTIGVDRGYPVGSIKSGNQKAGVSEGYERILLERLFPPGPPHPPTNVSAEPGDGFSYVTWDPPCLDGGSPVSSYVVTSSYGAKISLSAAEFRAKGYLIFTGLQNGSRVSFTVVAANVLGASAPSVASATIVPAYKRRLKPPQAPTSVSIALIESGIHIEITPSPADGGSPVLSYSVATTQSGKPFLLEGSDVIHSDPAHPIVRTIPGFFPSPGSTVAVAAVNVKGAGEPALARPVAHEPAAKGHDISAGEAP